VPAEDRPLDQSPVSTAELPDTPQRDRAIPAAAWTEAPAQLLALDPPARYLRRIGPWLLWRSGPPTRGDATYWVALADDLSVQHTLQLFPDGSAEGIGPSGARHTRFRSWKEDLRDHSSGSPTAP
jgi:hypothetical protein